MCNSAFISVAAIRVIDKAENERFFFSREFISTGDTKRSVRQVG